MKSFIIGICLLFTSVVTGLAYEARTTTAVKFRSGPGTNFSAIRVLPAGAQVDVGDCNESGSWCEVNYRNQVGFVSGRFVEPTEEKAVGWPRSYDVDDGGNLILYEPQITDWENFTVLKALLAAEYRKSKSGTPVFGVIELSGQTTRASDSDEVIISDIRVERLDFSALDRKELAALQLETGKLLPTGEIAVKEERIAVSLANSKQTTDVEGLKADPPTIFHSSERAILLLTDGEPVFAPVKGASKIEFVINTNWDLFRAEGRLWLRVEKSWLSADRFGANWSEAKSPSAILQELPTDGNWDEALAALPPAAFDGGAPRVFFSTEPAELIRFEGPVKLEPVPGTDLEWASNTESDLFKHRGDSNWYFLTAGRWFRSASLDGSWQFATNDLPDDFLNLPEDQPYYSVRASVPGTSEASEARIRASIPETARVEKGSISAEVRYNGEPAFEPIEGTRLSYAANTDSQVIKVGSRYFVVQDGVWFVANSPNGPWTLASEVPEEIYTIPPSSPVHNVTYVKVYRVEDDAVWYGYTRGYLHGFIAWGIIAYGTGWYYPPYWYRVGPVPIYYHRPITYGGGVYYNPALGRFGRYGYAYGPYRGIEARARWNPATGSYIRGARVYGPQGTRGFVSAYNPRTGTRAVARGGQGVYGSWASAGVKRGSEYVRVRAASGRGGTRAVRWDSSRGEGAIVGRRGNVYAGRDGKVYRNTGNGWQKWEKGSGWERVQRPDPIRTRDRATRGRTTAPAVRTPANRIAEGTRPKGQVRQRVQDKPKVRPQPRQAPQKRQATVQPRKVAPKSTARKKVPQQVARSQQVRRVSNQRSNRQKQYRKPPARSAQRSVKRRPTSGGRARGRRRR